MAILTQSRVSRKARTLHQIHTKVAHCYLWQLEQSWAPYSTTDRGWVSLAYAAQHPEGEDAAECLCVGNYLDYEHGEHYQPGEPTVHAVAYLCSPGVVTSRIDLGHAWVATVAEAVAWITGTVAAHMAVLS